MSANTDLISQFIGSFQDKDVDKILEYFTEDAVYTNIPMDPPNRGKAEIRVILEMFMGMAEAMEFVVHHQSETADGVVMNERSDRFFVNGQWITLPVMGVFEIDNGKIKAWRDYFDLNQFTSQMAS
ncbi:limonene-1,2-epoxide hydrolase family protein [Zhongshania sp.]|uniref:limonene-1,2-epoxide hydrolase family protein n=1 Tax=Zhongshania sp. TaxID=1971902 RepID=UPI00356B2992